MANLSKAHLPCPDCGSHDALSKYDDGSTYCFSCNTYHKGKMTEHIRLAEESIPLLRPDAGVFPVDGITDRRLTAETCKKYGVKVVIQAGGIAQHIYPYYDKSGALVAQKIRTVAGKQFHTLGNMGKGTLFGQNLFPAKGKYITVTEGECFTEDTEILTESGWVSVKDYSGGLVLDGEGHFQQPLCKIVKDYQGDMYKASTRFFDITATAGHNIIYRNKKGEMVKKPFKDLPWNFWIPLTVFADNKGLDMSDTMLQILVAISADGTIDYRKDGRKYVRISFKKQRKIDRMQMLLDTAGIEYHRGQHKSGHTCFCFNCQEAFKEFPMQWLSQLDARQRMLLIQELRYWDGHLPKTRKQIEYYTTNYKNAVFVQTLAHITGLYGGICEKNYTIPKWSKGYTVRICSNQQWGAYQRHKEVFQYSGKVYCVQMPSGSLLIRKGGHICVCGNCDALSIFQMQGSKYPVVSIKNGSQDYKTVKDNYEYLDSFDNIIICFDGDEAGRKGAQKVAEILPPKKVKIVKMPDNMKDANEFLKAGKVEEFQNLWWKAEEYKPKDIVSMDEMWDRLQEFNTSRSYIPTPWQGLNEMLYGVRPSQVVVFAAGTGLGKSLFLKTFIQHILKTTDVRVGAFFLEEVAEDTTISLMSLEAGLNLRKPDVWQAQKPEDLKKWFDDACAGHRLDLFDGFDFDDIDLLMDKIRYLSRARDCKVIVLDHITMVAEGSEENTVTKLNKLMSELKKVAVAESIVILAACHLRKSVNANKTHEEGGHVSLDDLKSSSSIKQLSDIVIGLERNSQDEDKVKANTTVLRVLKNRDFGTKGAATAVIYDTETTRLVETALDEFEA